MHKFLFYDKFIIFLYMFRALCAHRQESKLYYAASGIITLKQVSGLKLLKYNSIMLYNAILLPDDEHIVSKHVE